MFLRTSFVLMLLIVAENKNALGKSTTLPCHINYHNDDGSTYQERERYDVFITTHWIKYEGCYFYSSYADTNNTEQLKYNSLGPCSIKCKSSSYFGVKMNTCVCLGDQNWSNMNTSKICNHSCTDQWTNATCGLKDNWYFDVYNQMKVFQPDPEDQDEFDRNCMVAKMIDEINVTYKAVSCSEQHTTICITDEGGTTNLGDISISDINSNSGCSLPVDQWLKIKDELPNNTFVWTSFIRSNVHIWTNTNKKYIIPHNNSKCQLEAVNKNTLRLFNISLQCIDLVCTVLDENGTSITVTNKDDDNASPTIPMDLEYTSIKLLHSTDSNITTTTTNVERLDLSTNIDWSSIYETNATDAPFLYENSVFALQIGVAVSVSCLVILIATITCCVYKPKRGTYTFPISKSEENVVLAMEGPPQPTRSTDVLAENYSHPIDKASTSNETAGPRFCATKFCQNVNSQKAENGCEYQHLDFTLRSETSHHFADNSDYHHTRANMVSVFNQPWDTASCEVNKLCSQISKSVVQKGQHVHKSLIKRRASRPGSPKSKYRVSNNCDAWETQFNHQQFVFDSDVDNQINKSTDVTDSNMDVSNDEPEFIHAASSFVALPFSERINVKSTHIYDEPDDRRLSLRDRLLHMLPIRSDKMPFGIQLDLRGSRRESKIYSLATPIDEIDESVA